MKIEFTLTDDEGKSYRGAAELGAAGTHVEARKIPEPRPTRQPNTPSLELDFGKPLRPFIKTYGKGLSGPKKFALLLSWLAKGDPKNQIQLSEVQKHWNKMTAKSLLGMKFNRFFPAEARNNDWVESKKQGTYNLRPDWRKALKRKG